MPDQTARNALDDAGPRSVQACRTRAEGHRSGVALPMGASVTVVGCHPDPCSEGKPSCERHEPTCLGPTGDSPSHRSGPFQAPTPPRPLRPPDDGWNRARNSADGTGSGQICQPRADSRWVKAARGRVHREGSKATDTTGDDGGLAPRLPWKVTFPKEKMPPSWATIR